MHAESGSYSNYVMDFLYIGWPCLFGQLSLIALALHTAINSIEYTHSQQYVVYTKPPHLSIVMYVAVAPPTGV